MESSMLSQDASAKQTSQVLLFGTVIFVVVFALVLWQATSRASVQPINTGSLSIPPPTNVTGFAPLSAEKANKGVPNALPWSYTTPKAKRPARAFYVTLPLSVISQSNTILLQSALFLQNDPNTANNYPFQTVFVIPSTTPALVNQIRDVDSCLQNTTNSLECGIMPDIGPDNVLRADMSNINLTGPYQLCFGIQNRSAHTVQYLLDQARNIRFEIPRGKTAVFFPQSEFWPVLLFRQNNPGLPTAPQAQLVWKGALVPDRTGAYPEAKTNTYEEALVAAAAEIEAVYGARFGQLGGTSL